MVSRKTMNILKKLTENWIDIEIDRGFINFYPASFLSEKDRLIIELHKPRIRDQIYDLNVKSAIETNAIINKFLRNNYG